MIEVDGKALQQASDMLGGVEEDVRKVARRALVRALAASKTAGVRKVREKYTVRYSGLSSSIVTRRPSVSNLAGVLVNRGPRLSLLDFRVAPNMPETRKPRVGLRATVIKGGGGQIPGAFVTRMRSGRVGAFVRSGSSRYPIKFLSGPATAQMLGAPDVQLAMQERAVDVFEGRLLHEVERELFRRAKSEGLR